MSWSLHRKKWYLSCFWQHCMFLSPFLITFKLHQTLQFFLSSPLMNPAYAVPGTQAQESWRMVVFTNPDGQIRVEEQKNHHQVMKHNFFLFYFPWHFSSGPIPAPTWHVLPIRPPISCSKFDPKWIGLEFIWMPGPLGPLYGIWGASV